MSIYVLRFKVVDGEEWIKLGWAADVGQRLVDSLYSNSHPKALCNKLSKEWFALVAQYTATKEQERELQIQLNCGELHNDDRANEFYLSSELPKVLRELDTWFAKETPEDNLPFPWRLKEKRPCCTGRKIVCRWCKQDHFISTFNRDRHALYSCEKNPNRQTETCRFCDKVLGTAEAKKKHEQHHCKKEPN